MIGQRLSIIVTLIAVIAMLAARTESKKLRTRELFTTKELEEDAVFWGRELGGSSKGSKSGKGKGGGSKKKKSKGGKGKGGSKSRL